MVALVHGSLMWVHGDAKSRYRVRKWAEYEAGLQKRGDVTVWLSDAVLDAWLAPASGKPGDQFGSLIVREFVPEPF